MIQGILDYTFNDPTLLVAAVSSPQQGCVRIESGTMGLDLLGDAALGITVIQALIKDKIDLVCHGHLVSNAEFGRLCQSSGLLSCGQLLSCTGKSPKAADMFEAIFGAIYLDDGLSAVTKAYARVAALCSDYERRYLSACADSDQLFKLIDGPRDFPSPGMPFVVSPIMAAQLANSEKPGGLVSLGAKLIRLWAIDELSHGGKWPVHIEAHTHVDSRSGLVWQRAVAEKSRIHEALRENGYLSSKEAEVANFRTLIALAYLQGNWPLCKQVLDSARMLLEPIHSAVPRQAQLKLVQHNFVVELEGLLETTNAYRPHYNAWETRVAGGEIWYRCQLKLGREVFSEGGGSTEYAARQRAAEVLIDKILSGEDVKLPRHGDGRRS